MAKNVLRKYTVVTPVQLDEQRYESGETIELTDKQAAEIGPEVKLQAQ